MASPLTEPGPAVLPDGAGATSWEQLDVRGQTEPERPLPLLAPRPELLISPICLTAQEQF